MNWFLPQSTKGIERCGPFMNLEKMLLMQKDLDQRIIQIKGLEGKDLFPDTVLALQVELAEFANEGRWFKHWSDDQEPRITALCSICSGFGSGYFAGDLWSGKMQTCSKCKGTGKDASKKPLLEEFVDCIHFFLSIAIQKGWQEAFYIFEEQLDSDEFDGDLTAWYLEMIYFLNKSYMENPTPEENEKFILGTGFPENQYWFRMAWVLFLNIGINGFGFNFDQIEEAYFEKNALNHKRQETGY
jgi:dimeric dUTPase (all-alpha-NTP-PPase superfamily)